MVDNLALGEDERRKDLDYMWAFLCKPTSHANDCGRHLTLNYFNFLSYVDPF
nr:hypothetical protein HUO10_006424 [Paraburkholderia busanensis]